MCYSGHFIFICYSGHFMFITVFFLDPSWLRMGVPLCLNMSGRCWYGQPTEHSIGWGTEVPSGRELILRVRDSNHQLERSKSHSREGRRNLVSFVSHLELSGEWAEIGRRDRSEFEGMWEAAFTWKLCLLFETSVQCLAWWMIQLRL